MPSLFASLGIAREAIQAQQYALDVTQNNIANVNTPGYARQRVVLIPGEPQMQPEYQLGAGVRVGYIETFRNRFFDRRVNDEFQRRGEYSAASATLQQVEAIFNENAGIGLQSDIAAFFNSFGSLANAPEDSSLRVQVLARAEQLGSRFRQIYEQLQDVQSLQNQAVAETVATINTVSTAIARLNAEIQAARGTNTNENSLRDQRQQLLDQLAELTDISYFETESGSISVQSRSGSLLVAGSQAYAWETVPSSAGSYLEVHANGIDITATIQSGKLAGLLKVRDNKITEYLSALDDMAAAIISRVNAQHAQGADINGAAGGDFFVPFTPVVPGSNLGAARALQLAITDPGRIAAAGATGGPGSNANATLLAGIQNEPLLSGNSTSLHQFYASLIFRIGLDTQTALEGLETQGQLLTQLQNQRDAASAVSLDDEAVNVIRYQKAFEANARVLSIIDNLTEDLIRLLGE